MSLNWFMPALVNSSVGSFCGTSDDECTSLCPFCTKKSRNLRRISEPVSMMQANLNSSIAKKQNHRGHHEHGAIDRLRSSVLSVSSVVKSTCCEPLLHRVCGFLCTFLHFVAHALHTFLDAAACLLRRLLSRCPGLVGSFLGAFRGGLGALLGVFGCRLGGALGDVAGFLCSLLGCRGRFVSGFFRAPCRRLGRLLYGIGIGRLFFVCAACVLCTHKWCGTEQRCHKHCCQLHFHIALLEL